MLQAQGDRGDVSTHTGAPICSSVPSQLMCKIRPFAKPREEGLRFAGCVRSIGLDEWMKQPSSVLFLSSWPSTCM